MRFFFDIFFSFLMNNIIILYIIGSSMLRDEDFLIYIQNSALPKTVDSALLIQGSDLDPNNVKSQVNVPAEFYRFEGSRILLSGKYLTSFC